MKITHAERDSLFVKGITLFTQRGLPLPNFRAIPIEATAEDSVITLIQNISLLPGELHQLKGSFRKPPNSRFPTPLSFKLVSRSNQTGFPHPSQVLGLPFCVILVPPIPTNPQNLPFFCQILAKKLTFARLLLPGRKLHERATEQYAARQQVFAENKEVILQAHKKLMEHFIDKTHLDLFYTALLRAVDPYRTLTKSLKLYSDLFLKKLKTANDPEMMQQEGRFRLQEKLSNASPLKEAMFHFVLAIDNALTSDLTALVLNNKLLERQKILRLLVIKQLLNFLSELENNLPITRDLFLTSIEEESAILKGGPLSSELTKLKIELDSL